MPAAPADGGGMGAEVPNPGEWESWAREAETLWAAVSARKPRLEVASDSGRESVPGRDAGGVFEPLAAWPTARLFTPGTAVTPAESAGVAFAASTEPPASRGPTASVPGWTRGAFDASFDRPRDDDCPPTDAVSAFASASRAASAAEMRRRRESRPAAVAARAWRDVERAYLRTVRDGPLAGTPLALRRADAKRVALSNDTDTVSHGFRDRAVTDAMNALPMPRETVMRSFDVWRTRWASKRRARVAATSLRTKTLTKTFRTWRDDVVRTRTRRTVRAAIALETWHSHLVASRAARAVSAAAKTRAVKRGATGAFRVWRALADDAATLAFSADSFAYARRVSEVFRRWKKKAENARRDRAWCAFAETWRTRRVLARAAALWRRFAFHKFAARERAEALGLEKKRTRLHAVFFLWRRRASAIAAGVELVRLACVKWRFERMECAFGAFRAAASAKRAKRTASAAFYETKLLTKASALWRGVVVAHERRVFGAAVFKMRKAVDKVRVTRCVEAFRLAVFRGRERDREATEAFRSRKKFLAFRGWADVAEECVSLTDQLLTETARLGWPGRVRSRRAFVTWRERATHRRAYRTSVEEEVVVLASANRARRAVARWRLNAAEAVLAQLQTLRAKHHRLSFLFRLYRGEMARRKNARLETQVKLGASAIRRLATCHAGWRAFVHEMRPIRRRLRRYRETMSAGHVVSGKTVSSYGLSVKANDEKRQMTPDTHTQTVSAALRREMRDAQDAATVGPLVAAAARARVTCILRAARAGGANAANAARLRQRLGKVWSKMVARETADAFGGFRGDDAGAFVAFSDHAKSSFQAKPPKHERPAFFSARSSARTSASSTPGGSPAKRAKLSGVSPARRPGPGGGGGARAHAVNAFRANETYREKAFSPKPSPSRSFASEGFRSARSSMPGSAAGSASVSASVSRAPSANPSPAKAPTAQTERRDVFVTGDALAEGSGSAEAALRVLRERVAARLGAVAESPAAVSWSPSRQRDGSESPNRRQSSSKVLEMRARFDGE